MNAQFLFHFLKHYLFAQAEASKHLNWPMLGCLKTCQKYIEMAESPNSLDRKLPIQVLKNSLLLYGIVSHLTLGSIGNICVSRCQDCINYNGLGSKY